MSIFCDKDVAGLNPEGFNVCSVPPMHQLIEKMLLLHEYYHVRDLPARQLVGNARHLHDIVRLYEQLQQQGCTKIDQSLYRKLRKHRKIWFGRSTTLFRSSSFNKLCFIPPLNLMGPLMDDYRNLRKEVIFDRKLEFPALLGKIQQINGRLNGIEWHNNSDEPMDSDII